MQQDDPRSTGADGLIPDYASMKWKDRFMQMQTASWEPEFSTPWVISGLALTTVVFIPLGVLVLIASDKAQSIRVRYDNAPSAEKDARSACGWDRRVALARERLGRGPTPAEVADHCRTTIDFTLNETLDAPVYLYYELTGYNQNFRRLVDSRSDEQLYGGSLACICRDSLACPPQRHPGDFLDNADWWVTFNVTDGATGVSNPATIGDIEYAPCGQMAYAMFNDSFGLSDADGRNICNTSLFFANGTSTVAAADNRCRKDDIAWSGDKDERFKAIPLNQQVLSSSGMTYKVSQVQLPDGASGQPGTVPADASYIVEGWNRGYYWREWGHKIPEQDDLDFMVWSRPATLPTFRKLYRVIDVTLAPGRYQLTVEDRYPVSLFDAEKAVVLATRTWVGADNTVLGVAYTVIGSIACAFAVAFAVGNMMNPQGGYTREAFDRLDQDAFNRPRRGSH